ncbi:hypothetical protein [Oerskovia turbata]|uniref:hypothetical protein n=1 Tax=Oerskovia turbata TaxID=1713 RepID=UPI0004BFFEE1|nr:hypothetical protein [Oerskovia turbata]
MTDTPAASATSPATARTLQGPGATLHHEVRGQGPLVVLVGVGEDSTGQLCDRTSTALAALLGTTTTLFPGDHTGFVDHPAAFAQRLRKVLGTA